MVATTLVAKTHGKRMLAPTANTPSKRRLVKINSNQASGTVQAKSASQSDTNEIGEFPPGSIVRVALRHFVTYDACQFSPGPHLNMIIGPNGTGKSTIVCAIALGLGGNTSILGRAKDISEFVKHGYDRASIEIELKGHPGHRNPVIKRHIQRSSNSSTWKLNGHASTFKEIQETVRSFRIQVDNLCQFLPQDKVCEFAQMNSAELLRETQKAAGEAQLADWHSQLILLRNQEKSLQATTRDERESIDNLVKRNAVLERDVLRFQEREAILRQIKIIETRIPFAQYAEVKDRFDTIKEERKTVHQNYKQLQRQHQPHLELKASVAHDIQVAERRKNSMEDASRRSNQQFETKMTEIEKLDAECDDQRNRLGEIKNREESRKRQMAELKRDIELLQRDIGAGPPEDPTADLTRQMDELGRQLRDMQSRVDELQGQQQDIMAQSRNARQQMERKQTELQQLEDVRNQRLVALERFDADTHKAVLWLRQNRDQFQEYVFEPICLEINITDANFAKAVESLIQSSTMKTFVCQTEGDYHLFTREINDRLRLKANVVLILDKTLADYKAPVSPDQLHDFGFEKYALDLIDGPAPVLVALCDMEKIHATPLSRRAINHDRVDSSRLLRQYVAQDTVYQIQFSRYGNRLPFVTTKVIRPGRFLTQSANVEHKAALEDDIDRLRSTLSGDEGRVKELRVVESRLRTESDGLQRERELLTNRKREYVQRQRDYERQKIRLESHKEKLQDLRLAPEQDLALQADIRTKLHSLAVRRGRCVIQSKECLRKLIESQSQSTQAFLTHLQAINKLSEIDRQLETYDRDLKAAAEAYREVTDQFNEAKAQAVELLAEADQIKNRLDPELWDEVLQYGKDMSLDELETALVSERTKAELTHAANPVIVEQYRARTRDIEKLQAQLAQSERELTDTTAELTRIRSQWETQVATIVERISTHFAAAFDRIGCAGEVRLSRHDDFDKWGIDILVKFRESEQLQVLTGQRQSGGERSVSTILYLMALQELAVAPFRVVDEINQGMDPRNERMIHHQLVQVACETLSAQYFLITPKLLPNLEYHPRMKVLCIYNGEWQPEKFHIGAYIRNKAGG
ncbi:Structural maintenance of chromosomes protein 5 [Dimargaris cristalligena]|nr:Structural maintenance of chromosomes protein 5 [Dimargaris cristalligena]